ncbi:hypothetical protein [Candidatus Velamenicoccus archaeovorus]|uniref:hypothetical protein n=1 Tax=Velamenicoccus archaeovorus TaxID=1930593 RepID=UPI0013E8CF90|nr:hypothetical protein [Candidatus Velamenicoccus archaeovorus]
MKTQFMERSELELLSELNPALILQTVIVDKKSTFCFCATKPSGKINAGFNSRKSFTAA